MNNQLRLRRTFEKCRAFFQGYPPVKAVPSKPNIKKLHTHLILSGCLLSARCLLSCQDVLYLQDVFLSCGQALDRLVPVSLTHCCAYTPGLSTSYSPRGLTGRSLRRGISHLEGGFTLRCLQRLSLPDLATLPWLWQANRYTSGPSIPVLSY